MLHMNLWMELEYGDIKVEISPHTNRVSHQIISAPRDRRFERKLEKITGNKIENHSCYKIIFNDGIEVVFQVEDNRITIGAGISPA